MKLLYFGIFLILVAINAIPIFMLLHDFFKRKRYGCFLASFLYSLSPLSSNAMCITFGIMKVRSLGIFLGFWMGRIVRYYIIIVTSNSVLRPFMESFSNHLIGIIITDAVEMLSVIVFSSINWFKIITERKLEFIKPKLWKI